VNIKLDENLPERLAQVLSDFGHDVDTVLSEQLAGHDDADVWSAAQSVGRFLITQDLDFSDLRQYTPGTHAGLLLVRLRTPGRVARTGVHALRDGARGRMAWLPRRRYRPQGSREAAGVSR
jgi:predicted nuclease of predicted toxin-antitoxin system